MMLVHTIKTVTVNLIEPRHFTAQIKEELHLIT